MILKLNKIDKYKFFIVSIHLTNTNGISFINEIFVHMCIIMVSIFDLTFQLTSRHFMQQISFIYSVAFITIQCHRCNIASIAVLHSCLSVRCSYWASINSNFIWMFVQYIQWPYTLKITRRGILVWQTKDVYLRDLNKCRQWIRQYNNSNGKDPWMVNPLAKWWSKQTY